MALKVLGRFLEAHLVNFDRVEHSVLTIEVEQQSLLQPLPFFSHCLC